MRKAQLLHVQYREDLGLIFEWNYATIRTEEIYFRHVIAIFCDQGQEVNNHLKKYIRKIRGGDFYYIIYTNTRKEVKKIGWKEKPVVDQTSPSKSIIKEKTSVANRQLILDQIQQFYEDFSEPVVTTFLVANSEDKEYIQQRIQQKRYHGKYDFIVSFFCPQDKNILSYGTTVSTLSTSKDSNAKHIDLFLNTVYQAGLLQAKLTVECRNGSITSMSNNNWRTTEFNQIERTYRGPSVKYEKDILFFYNRTHQDSCQELTLKLQFETLDRRKFRTVKKLKVFSSKAFYQKTFNMEPWIKSYHAGKDIWLSENPFSTFTVIKFEGVTVSLK